MRPIFLYFLPALTLALLTLAPAQAPAFCGFFVSGADAGLYNNASQVVLMRKGQKTVMSMSNTYKGPLEDFAMVVPVPVILKKEHVKTLPLDVFKKIDEISAPRLVEYWEQDPCYREVRRKYSKRSDVMAIPSSAAPRDGRLGVTVEASFKVGEYEIVILSAKEANGLETWLKLNRYSIPKGASTALAPYIQEGMKFFVAKVDIKKVKRDDEGVVTLSPLRFDFESKDLRLPVRLGLLNASEAQDLLIYVLHPSSRFEVANYPNVFIPTNLEVEQDVRKNFGGFYTRLFDEVLKTHDHRAVVTEYAWQTTSCDPCPVPPLTSSDLFTLGGDVFSTSKATRKRRRGKRRPPQRSRPVFTGNFSSWILTRLHTRYSQETLSEDLVFVPASPVRGGRGANGVNQEAPGAVEKSRVNQFQGRYIIRNYWEGKVSCDHPRYGRWGGPPSSSGKVSSGETASSNGGLGRAQAGDQSLNTLVRSSLKRLKIKGKPEPTR